MWYVVCGMWYVVCGMWFRSSNICAWSSNICVFSFLSRATSSFKLLFWDSRDRILIFQSFSCCFFFLRYSLALCLLPSCILFRRSLKLWGATLVGGFTFILKQGPM